MKKFFALLLALCLCVSMTGCVFKANLPEGNGLEYPSVKPSDGTISSEPDTEEPSHGEDIVPAPTGSTPVLYKVTSKNGGTVWIFGSIHVGIDEMYPLPDYVMDAYAQADALAVECDVIEAANDTDVLMQALQNMIYLDDTTISDHIPEELYNSAVEILKENNSYMKALDYYHPVLWWNFIESFSYVNYGYDSEAGIDMFLLNMAKDEGKPILEVESVSFQYEILASFSPELQVVLLEDAVAAYGSEEVKNSLDELLLAWCAGDEAALVALLNEESDAEIDPEIQALIEEYNNAMVVQRNISMTDWAEDVLEEGGCVFICVGTAHVLGEGAMIDLLQQRGYTVERVTE